MMSGGPANGAAAKGTLDLPAFSLDVQALDLGTGVKAGSPEILETESREPVRGKPATDFWSAVCPLLTAGAPFVLDVFSSLAWASGFGAGMTTSAHAAGTR